MNLDELERLEREATEGPWSSTPSDPSQGYECFWLTACPEINQEREIATVCGPQNERNTSNAVFIAALRNAARELIAEAKRYRWLRDEAPEKWAAWADERDQDNCNSSEIDAAIDAAMQEQKP